MNTPSKTMHVSKYITRICMLALLITGFSIDAAVAQDDDQQYKKDFNAAREAAQAKDYNAAYDLFAKAAEGAVAQGDEGVQASALKVLAQLDNARGNQALKAERCDDALAHFDKGIEHFPTNSRNYANRADAIMCQGNTEEALAAYQRAMQVAESQSDTKIGNYAEAKVRRHFLKGVADLLGGNPGASQADQVIGIINDMQSYVELESKEFYYMAVAYNIKREYTQGAMMSDQALETGGSRISRRDRSDINFVKGEALMNSGESAGAVEAFKLVTTGSFRPNAEHNLCELGEKSFCKKAGSR